MQVGRIVALEDGSDILGETCGVDGTTLGEVGVKLGVLFKDLQLAV